MLRGALPRRLLASAVMVGCAARAGAAIPEGAAFLVELPADVLPYSIGANGFVLLGTFFRGGAFHWMPTSGATRIGGTEGIAISRDGRTLVGSARDAGGFENAAIWTGGETWRVLGSIRPGARPCDQLLSGAFDASGDATVIVGLAWDGCGIARAFRWEESTGVVDLGSLSGDVTRASGVSADGRVVVGFEEAADGFRQGAKWVDGREEIIRRPSGIAVGEAYGANRDGSLIVGSNCNPADFTPPPTAWTWTPSAGITCFPVAPPPWALPFPYRAIMEKPSDDGRVIGGALSFGLDAESVVWFDGEAFMLRDYLRANGVPDAFQGWYNTGFVTDVSGDGRILVGYGAGQERFQGFMVILPPMPAR